VIALKPKEKEMADVIVRNTYEVADGLEKYGDFFWIISSAKQQTATMCCKE